MTGNQLREIIERKGISLSATAFAMGLPTPMHLQGILKSPDVKSSYLEAAAKALGMTIPEMYAAQSDVPSPLPKEPQPSDQKTDEDGDIQKVLLHLTALVTEQTKKIDDLTNQVADLRATLQHRRSIHYNLDATLPSQVSDTTEIK